MILATALLAWVGAWAESPLLVRKATDPSFFAVRTFPELLVRSYGNPAPRSEELCGTEPNEWRWQGRRLEVFRSDRDSVLEAGMGNEVGDPLFREARESTDSLSANRNPALWFHLPTPRLGGVRLALDYDQVDHYSNASLGARTSRIGHQRLHRVDPEVRRAWFGENLPDASMLGMRAWGGTELDWFLTARSGWLWMSAPVSNDLQAWRVNQGEGSIDGARWSWHHAQARFERADTAQGRLDQAQGWIEGRPWADSSLRVGLHYAWDHSTGQAWSPDREVLTEPWFAVRLPFAGLAWRGFHAFGQDGYRLRDTLTWERGGGDDAVAVSLAAQWTDRPEGRPTSREVSSAGVAVDGCGRLEQTWLLSVRRSWSIPGGALALEGSPWALLHPHAFEASGYDTSDGWIRRAGRTVALPGWLWGWKLRGQIRQDLSRAISLDGVLQADPVFGEPQGRVDLTPPLWGAGGGVLARHPSGLSLQAQLLWRDEATLRNASPSAWRVPAGWDANLWIRQALFRERLELECAMLDLLADGDRHAPNASEDLFRVLVRVRVRI